jgi:hypothetical protein
MKERQRGRLHTVTPRSGKASMENLVGAAAALHTALRIALDDLAEGHGKAGGVWLDELEDTAIRQVKATVGEGIPIEAEADALQFGVDTLKAAFNAFRDHLIAAEDKE